MPRAERTPPPYVQIQDHFRSRILSGEIAEGDRLPSIAAIAEEWGVAAATAAKAMTGLGVEGYTVTSTQGTYATVGKGAVGARDLAMLRGRAGASGSRVHITEADVRPAPVYVAELLGMDPAGARVARREWITYDGPRPIRLSVSWWSASLADRVPRLGTSEPGDTLEWIRQDAGRAPSHGRDYFEGREADLREAKALGIKPGAPVLASTYLWWDGDGVIEYGEFVLPRKRVVSFAYAIEQTQQTTDHA